MKLFKDDCTSFSKGCNIGTKHQALPGVVHLGKGLSVYHKKMTMYTEIEREKDLEKEMDQSSDSGNFHS